MRRIPLIKFPQRHLPAKSAGSSVFPSALRLSRVSKCSSLLFLWFFLVGSSSPSDEMAFLKSRIESQPKAASSSGDSPSYRFRSNVPAPPSNTAVGGKASLLPKRTPVSDSEIEAILLGGCF